MTVPERPPLPADAEFEVGSAILLHALHCMPVEGPEGVLHSHDYRIEVVVSRRGLDDRGMVCDLDVLNAVLAKIHRDLEGKDLEIIRPQWAEAVTVEVFARWLHETVGEAIRASGADFLSVRVWESDSEFGGFRASLNRGHAAGAR
ncbi:MAG: 6-carboxytetrahydropterin synthase [Actinomycetota bacterium]|nr:6-carboxytetrahydropterin synthase [Actinomycetota bacterium]